MLICVQLIYGNLVLGSGFMDHLVLVQLNNQKKIS